MDLLASVSVLQRRCRRGGDKAVPAILLPAGFRVFRTYGNFLAVTYCGQSLSGNSRMYGTRGILLGEESPGPLCHRLCGSDVVIHSLMPTSPLTMEERRQAVPGTMR